jgi:putative effector of murein hydrolase LrgA (UPF0299 family)
MIASLAAILLCQLLGEAIARGLGLPLPGPVIGMAVMLALLALRDATKLSQPRAIADGTLESTARALLAQLSLLFVPAGVGVIQNLRIFGHYGVALAVALLISTLAALLATVVTFVWVAKRFGAAQGEP